MNKTVVYVIHDLNHAARFADDLILVKAGRVVAQGAVENLFTTDQLRECFGLEVTLGCDTYTKSLMITGVKKMTKSRYYLLISSLLFLIIGLSVIYLLVGDQNYPLSALTSQPIILQLRLPRLFGVILVGILLSISGFLVQLMTKNPIAELSTLGISGGASLGMSILLAFGLSTNAGFSALVASIGAFVALFLVISLTARTHFQPLKVILVGTSVGLFATSLASAVTFAKHDSQSYFFCGLWLIFRNDPDESDFAWIYHADFYYSLDFIC